MNRYFILLISFFLSACSALACGDPPSKLEQAVMQRAKADPVGAPEYFLQRIESGATPEEQAVYLYGMGLAHQIQGDTNEARNDYLSAGILGNSRAKCGLMELPQIKDAETTDAPTQGERENHDRSSNYKNGQ